MALILSVWILIIVTCGLCENQDIAYDQQQTGYFAEQETGNFAEQETGKFAEQETGAFMEQENDQNVYVLKIFLI